MPAAGLVRLHRLLRRPCDSSGPRHTCTTRSAGQLTPTLLAPCTCHLFPAQLCTILLNGAGRSRSHSAAGGAAPGCHRGPARRLEEGAAGIPPGRPNRRERQMDRRHHHCRAGANKPQKADLRIWSAFRPARQHAASAKTASPVRSTTARPQGWMPTWTAVLSHAAHLEEQTSSSQRPGSCWEAGK